MSVSSASTYSLNPRQRLQIYLVAWGGGNTAHWALFLPNSNGVPYGTLFHIGVNGTRSSKGDANLEIRSFVMTISDAHRCIELHGAEATFYQLEDASKHVHSEYKYNMITSNCQNFAVQVLERLNQLYPTYITSEAIQHATSRGTISTYLVSLRSRPSPNRQRRDTLASRVSQSERWTID